MPELIDPSAPILWLLRGGKVLTPIPLVKMFLSTAALANVVATYAAEHTGEKVGGIDIYTPEIQKYEFSALGSTRII